jgi:hypothetical protein
VIVGRRVSGFRLFFTVSTPVQYFQARGGETSRDFRLSESDNAKTLKAHNNAHALEVGFAERTPKKILIDLSFTASHPRECRPAVLR